MSRSVTVRLPDHLYAELTKDGASLSASLIQRLDNAAATEAVEWACAYPLTAAEREQATYLLTLSGVRECMRGRVHTKGAFKRHLDLLQFVGDVRTQATIELWKRSAEATADVASR